MIQQARRILLGICGSIATYKAAELLRMLQQNDFKVRVILSGGALNFIQPLTFQALSGKPVATDLFDPQQEAAMGHINLARWADVILVAPASANFIARLANGMCDDLLSTTCSASNAPILLAPAMNHVMWSKQQCQNNLERLAELGVKIIPPDVGMQVCGEIGMGKLASLQQIVSAVLGAGYPQTLAGKKVLITAGPTREFLDGVRFISNKSSGKMGAALALAALSRGAEVSVISGPVNINYPLGVKVIPVESAAEMNEQAQARIGRSDVFIAVAAVSDYRFAHTFDAKVKKREKLNLELNSTPDILHSLASTKKKGQLMVGFAAENKNALNNARQKLKSKNLDLICLNSIDNPATGFDSDNNAVTLLFANDCSKELKQDSKINIAHQIIEEIIKLWKN